MGREKGDRKGGREKNVGKGGRQQNSIQTRMIEQILRNLSQRQMMRKKKASSLLACSQFLSSDTEHLCKLQYCFVKS